MKEKQLTQSLEKYLLAIYELVKQNSAARVKDVSNYLQIGGPATSDAIKSLTKKGYINYVPYGLITLTKKGEKAAENKIHRHKIICDFLKYVLIIDEKRVEKSATQIEYSMDEEVLERFISFLSFMDKCSCKEPKWMKSFSYYALNNSMQQKCQDCMSTSCSNCCCGGCSKS